MDYTYVIYRVFLNTIYVIHGILCRWLLPRLGSGVRVSFPAPNSKSPHRKMGAFLSIAYTNQNQSIFIQYVEHGLSQVPQI